MTTPAPVAERARQLAALASGPLKTLERARVARERAEAKLAGADATWRDAMRAAVDAGAPVNDVAATDGPEHDLRAAMHRHPAGRRRPLRAVPRDSHSWGQPSRPGSDDRLDALLRATFVAVFLAAVLAAVWVDWRWAVTAVVVDLVVAWIGGRRQQRRGR